MPIGKHPPGLDWEPLRPEQLFPSRGKRRLTACIWTRLVVACARPAVPRSNVDATSVLDSSQAIVEISHRVHEGHIEVSNSLDDGSWNQHNVAVHRIARERCLHMRRCFFP